MVTILNNSTQKALTTLARAKSFLEVSGDSKDSVLTMIINQVSGSIEAFLKRRLLSQTYTDEKYDGTGSETLVLKNFPVTAFTNLKVNVSGDSSESLETISSERYFWYQDGRVVLNTGSGFVDGNSAYFVKAPNKYRATYTAGYLIDFDNENTPASHTLPQELEYACLKLVSAVYNSRKGEGLQSIKVGDIAMTFKKTSVADEEVSAILNKYVSATL